jgi:hypothetical protein
MLFAAMHESALGPKRTWPSALQMSAFGGKADMPIALRMSAFDPKRTLADHAAAPFGLLF